MKHIRIILADVLVGCLCILFLIGCAVEIPVKTEAVQPSTSLEGATYNGDESTTPNTEATKNASQDTEPVTAAIISTSDSIATEVPTTEIPTSEDTIVEVPTTEAPLNEDHDFLYLISIDDELLVFGKKGVIANVPNFVVEDFSRSKDGTRMLVWGDGVLQLFDGEKFYKIDTGVKLANFQSPNNDTFAYICNNKSLYIYSYGNIGKIADGVGGMPVFSNDWTTVGYVKYSPDNTPVGYIYDGEEWELGENIEPVAISPDGTYIYYKTQSRDLYVQKGKSKESRTLIANDYQWMSLNQDGTQVVADDHYCTYFCEKAEPRIKIADFVVWTQSEEDMRNALYYSNGSEEYFGNVYRLNANMEMGRLLKNVYRVAKLKNSNVIVYLKNNCLYKMDLTLDNPIDVLLAENVQYNPATETYVRHAFVVSNDETQILYMDQNNIAYIVNLDGENRIVTTERVVSWNRVGNGFVCSTYEGELIFDGNGKTIRITGLDDDATTIAPSGNGTYVTINTRSGSVYLTTDGTTIIKLFKIPQSY